MRLRIRSLRRSAVRHEGSPASEVHILCELAEPAPLLLVLGYKAVDRLERGDAGYGGKNAPPMPHHAVGIAVVR